MSYHPGKRSNRHAKSPQRGGYQSGRTGGNQWSHRCESCDKLSYAERDRAKAAIRGLRGDGAGMREYRCPQQRDYWHIGHLPSQVIRGKRTAGEVYRKGEDHG